MRLLGWVSMSLDVAGIEAKPVCAHRVALEFGIVTEDAGETAIPTHRFQTCVLFAKAPDLSTLGLDPRAKLKNKARQIFAYRHKLMATTIFIVPHLRKYFHQLPERR
ncbi:unnamed protein product [Prunus brigantina]